MAEVLAAYAAYKQADEDALLLRFRARATLGKSVTEERRNSGKTQNDVAGKLEVATEQVRRYERAYRDWMKQHPDEPLD
jgi:ribosome-binding protein aMBF1 (putative translation factor)